MASVSAQQEVVNVDQNLFRRMVEKFGSQKWLLYGAISGGLSRTATAPLERLKVLNQVNCICGALESEKQNKTKTTKEFSLLSLSL